MQRHDFDPIAFIFGVVFTGLGVLFMAGRIEVLNQAQWLWPGLLVLLGLAVLLGARGRGGARARRPALEQGSTIDPALEDELLHAPMTSIDSDLLVDSRSLFTLGQGSSAARETATEETEATGRESPAGERPAGEKPAEEAPAGEKPADETPADGRPAERTTEVLPEARVDRDADTELLPPRDTREEG